MFLQLLLCDTYILALDKVIVNSQIALKLIMKAPPQK